jgi:hypothetical protein
MHTVNKRQGKSGTIDIKALVREDEEFLRALVRTALQEVLEAEMTEALGAEKGERAAGRQGYRSGYYGRTLITGSANWRCGCRRIGPGGSRLNCLNAISARSGRWWRLWRRSTCKGFLQSRSIAGTAGGRAPDPPMISVSSLRPFLRGRL